eukprot:CAMPEP_0168608234 /NCGR_PEP_ID=MMETSP0449_2-20121227/514_1 /TAXON_ID=1082188 /ORGANISM="Strombidium rassoulzadegani, Strain ras09" /LENGTH=114 /DNA_ID=CAMNT_0008648197 /DNA_START=23 /DNA_END=367 /DNA_ORIENTATION=+
MKNFSSAPGHSAADYMVTTPSIKQSSLEEMIEQYRYFIFDCDGVLFHSKDEIGRAFKALDLIKQHDNKDVFFFTNATTRVRGDLLKKVQVDHDFFNITVDKIYTASYLTGVYLN